MTGPVDEHLAQQAPELDVLALLELALSATERALRREQPGAFVVPECAPCPVPTHIAAARLVKHAHQLKSAIRRYQVAVDDALAGQIPLHDDGLPF